MQLKEPRPKLATEELGHGVDEFLDLKGWLERIVQKDRHLSPAQERHAHKGRVHP